MERTYVFNTIFKVMAIVGIISIFGLAGSSDLGEISSERLFIQGGISIFAAVIGVWGAMNCTRIIETEKRRSRRQKRSVPAANFSDAA